MVSTFYKLYLGGNQGGDPQLYFRLSSLFRQVRSIQTTLCGDPTLIGAARPPGGYSYGGYSHETCRHRIKWVLSVPTSKRALWVKARPDYEPLFSILDGLFISAVCRCAPPGNKPTPHEIDNCLTYQNSEIELSGDLQGYAVLGQIAFDYTLRLLNCLFRYFWLIFSFLILCK